MLTIRSEQLDALAETSLCDFVDQTLGHAQRFFPRHCAVSGEQAMRAAVGAGAATAQELGYTAERDVTLVLNLAILLGSEFDRDPQLSSLVAVLGADEFDMTARARLDRLYDDAMDYLDRMAGRNDEFIDRARRNAARALRDEARPLGDLRSDAEISEFLRTIYPQKADDLGSGRLGAVIAAADGLAPTLGAPVALVAMNMILFGSGFADDPLFGWQRDQPGSADLLVHTRELLDRWLATA